MTEYISAALILLITLPCIKISFKRFNPLSKENSSNVKGLLCILIFYHHFTGWFVDKGIIFYVLSHIGSFIVGVFFFLSAYGLIKAYPGDVKFSFLLKRFVKILVPYWICEAIYVSVSLAFDIPLQVTADKKQIALSAILANDLVEFSWFVGAILVAYAMFFIGKKILPKIALSLKVAVLMLIFSAVFYKYLDYWTTFFAFSLGLFFGEKEDKISSLSAGKRIAVIAASAVLCAAATVPKFYGFSIGNNLYMNVSDFFTSSLFAVFVYFIMSFVKIGNPVLSFFGKISYEVYLLQGIAVRIANKVFGVQNSIPFFFLSFAVLVLLSYIVSTLSSFITKPVVKRL